MDYSTIIGGSAGVLALKKFIDMLASLTKTRFEAPIEASAENKAALIKEQGRHELLLLEAKNKIAEITEISRLSDSCQTNLNAIFNQTVDELANEGKENPSEENIEHGWLLSFIDYAKNISNNQIQSIWSKILAGEINRPGKFSLRTLDLLKNISISEANLFTDFCSNVLIIENGKINPCYFTNTYGCSADRFVTQKFSQQERIILSEMGLVSFEEEDILFNFQYDVPYLLSYLKSKILIRYKGKERRGSPEEIKTIISGYQLTMAGQELYELCSPKYLEDYWSNIKEKLIMLEFEVNDISQR